MKLMRKKLAGVLALSFAALSPLTASATNTAYYDDNKPHHFPATDYGEADFSTHNPNKQVTTFVRNNELIFQKIKKDYDKAKDTLNGLDIQINNVKELRSYIKYIGDVPFAMAREHTYRGIAHHVSLKRSGAIEASATKASLDDANEELFALEKATKKLSQDMDGFSLNFRNIVKNLEDLQNAFEKLKKVEGDLTKESVDFGPRLYNNKNDLIKHIRKDKKNVFRAIALVRAVHRAFIGETVFLNCTLNNKGEILDNAAKSKLVNSELSKCSKENVNNVMREMQEKTNNFNTIMEGTMKIEIDLPLKTAYDIMLRRQSMHDKLEEGVRHLSYLQRADKPYIDFYENEENSDAKSQGVLTRFNLSGKFIEEQILDDKSYSYHFMIPRADMNTENLSAAKEKNIDFVTFAKGNGENKMSLANSNFKIVDKQSTLYEDLIYNMKLVDFDDGFDYEFNYDSSDYNYMSSIGNDFDSVFTDKNQ